MRLRQLGLNYAEVHIGQRIVLFAHGTPIVVFEDEWLYVTLVAQDAETLQFVTHRLVERATNRMYLPQAEIDRLAEGESTFSRCNSEVSAHTMNNTQTNRTTAHTRGNQRTFNIVRVRSGKVQYEKVQGYDVHLDSGFDGAFTTFYRKRNEHYTRPRGWVLCDLETGAQWTTGKTLADAVERFVSRIGDDNLEDYRRSMRNEILRLKSL